MSYLKNIDKIKYDPELIKIIQMEAGINPENGIIKSDILGFSSDKRLLYQNKSLTDPNEAARIENLRNIIKNVATVLGKVFIGGIIERFVDNKVNTFALKVIKSNTGNAGLANYVDIEIDKTYKRHPEYTTCTIEQFKRTSIFNYVMSEWRDKDTRQIAIQVRKHIVDSALTAAIGVGVPIPGSTILVYPVKATLQYWGLDLGTSLTELIVSYKSHCLSMGIYLRPIGFAINNIILYSFKEKDKLVATNFKDPPEDVYKITPEEAKRILKKYKDTELVKRDIDLIYSKSGMEDKK